MSEQVLRHFEDKAREHQRDILHELRRLRQGWSSYSQLLPDCRPCPVMVLPGYNMDNRSISYLSQSLREKGAIVHDNGLEDSKLTFEESSIDRVEKRLHEIFEEENQPVVVVGWSVGGLVAQELARLNPDEITQIVALGAPLNEREEMAKDDSPLSCMRADFAKATDQERMKKIEEMKDYFPNHISRVSIYSLDDELVTESMARLPDGPNNSNVQVSGVNHWTLGVHLRTIGETVKSLANLPVPAAS